MQDDVEGQQTGSAPVTAIVDRLRDTTAKSEVSIGDAVDAFGRRSFLPVLMVPSLMVLSPLSGIPLFSTLCGLSIALIAAQMLWPGRNVLWLPRFITARRVEGRRARAALVRLYGVAGWLDARAKERLCGLVRPPGRQVVEVGCLVSGLAMPFLEFVPFSSSVLGGAVLLMSLGLLARDGLFALAGLLAMVAAASVVWSALTAVAAVPG